MSPPFVFVGLVRAQKDCHMSPPFILPVFVGLGEGTTGLSHVPSLRARWGGGKWWGFEAALGGLAGFRPPPPPPPFFRTHVLPPTPLNRRPLCLPPLTLALFRFP